MGKKKSMINTIGFLLLNNPVLFSTVSLTVSFLFVSILFLKDYKIQIVKRTKPNNKFSLSDSKKKNKKTEKDTEEDSYVSIFS
jgi:hypothetical protein